MNTAQDLVAHLLASTGGGAQDGEHQAVRHAVISGVREVMQCRDWLWHEKMGSFATKNPSTVAKMVAGNPTISVSDATHFIPGRIVQFPKGTFQSPARIKSVNGTFITLTTAPKTSGENVLVKPQVFYDLPADLSNIGTLKTNTVGTLHCRISPTKWQQLEINTDGSGEPYYYTVMRSDANPDRYQIRFVGVPADGVVVHFVYRITPKPVKYFGYERICREGTVDLTQNATDKKMYVTGTGTSFPQDCAGAYIRFGSDGHPADPVGSTVPFIVERRIEEWKSATSLIVSDNTVYERPMADGTPRMPADYDAGNAYVEPPPSVSNDQNTPYPTTDYDELLTPLPALTKYAITDVINSTPQMWTAILSAVEMWYARIAGKPGDVAMAIYNRDLRLAMEADVVTPMDDLAHGSYQTPRSMGWQSSLLPDNE
jgi:hypothetical protein